MLTYKEEPYIDDKTGRKIVRITPVFSPSVCAIGEILFPFWEYFEDNESREEAISKAMNNAKETIISWGKNVSS